MASKVEGGGLQREEPGMVHIAGEILINRPVDEVFDFVADARNEPRYNPRMLRAEKLSSGPIGVGTRFRDELRSMGRAAEVAIEVTGYQRPRWLAESVRASMTEIRGTLAFDPVPAGTRMRWSWEVRPRGVLRLLSPVVARLGRGQERTVWSSLKRVLEAQEAPSATGR